MDIPTISASEFDMKNFLPFIYKYESILKQYGGLKIHPPPYFKDLQKRSRVKVPPCSIKQQISKINANNNSIFRINTITNTNDIEEKTLRPMTEATFWSSISYESNNQEFSAVETIPNQSLFLKRVYRSDFCFHELPQRSLLKLCRQKALRNLSSTLVYSRGPGGIFPLSSSRQNLFTFNYHHEGAVRYWYIIPSHQQERLENILNQQIKSTRYEHDDLLVDPLLLDQYGIHYHRVVQYPREILILSAGSITQSFTEDKMWNESIEFALPSWIYDGHAYQQSFCCSKLTIDSSIDLELFHSEQISKYINDYLNQDYSQNEIYENANNSIVPTSYNNQLSVSNESVSTDKSDNIIDILTPDTVETSSSTDDYFDNMMVMEELYQQLITDKDSNALVPLGYEESVDLLDNNSTTLSLTEIPMELDCDYDDGYHSIAQSYKSSSSSSSSKSNKLMHQNTPIEKNSNRVLYISHLNCNVTKSDLKNHFPGSSKITIKSSKLPPYLNYAFIFHQKQWQAKVNLRRRLNASLFGSTCRVTFCVQSKKNVSTDNNRR